MKTAILKIRKKFTFEGLELQIVSRQEPYLNSREGVIMDRVIAPNGGSIPVNFSGRDTLKAMQEKTISFLLSVKNRGADIHHELTREIEL